MNTEGDPVGDLPILPIELSDRLFALMFGDPALREAAFAELLAANPAHAEALQAHFRHHVEMEGGAVAPTVLADVALIPGYRPLAVLGEGGMGTVYRAEQLGPVHRLVALKVIKPGMDSKAVLSRFEQERQALAAMDHDTIAKVFDCGTNSRGQPYFAMELVEGLPIQRYCDEHRLALKQRIELFMQVCQGVHHAHQKGVIHRDLKPGNIMVVAQQGRHAVKIIDFGLARATDRRLAVGSLFTEQGMIVGTPEYMSPEQAAGDVRRVDTRTDVYSLGVILYELLVGELPFPGAELRAAALAEIQRRLCDVEPPKPSTRLSALGRAATTCAALRRVGVEALRRELARDLDWVVLKAMAKEPQRRYESATALADDLQRYLAHEPLIAGPPSGWYRLRKLVRRYRQHVLAATAVFLALVGGGIATFVQYVRAEAKAEDNAKLAQEKTSLATAEETAKLAAQASASAAEQRTKDLEQVLAFQEAQWKEVDSESMGVHLRRSLLDSINEARRADFEAGLAGVNFTSLGLGMLRENLFERSLAAIGKGFGDRPLVKARLLQSIAITLNELGLLDLATAPQTEALEIRRRNLGDEHPDTLTSITIMGMLLDGQGKLGEAEPFFREALEKRRRTLGDEHPDTLISVNNMGSVLQAQGKLIEAEPFCWEALEECRRILGDEHRDTLTSIHNMGSLLQAQGKLADAEPYYRESLEKSRRIRGEEHPDTLTCIHNMGFLLRAQGQFTAAESYCREALEKRRRTLGDDHLETVISISAMGTLLREQGKVTEAEPFYREALERFGRILGNEHPSTLTAIDNMGALQKTLGKLTEAEAFRRDALERFRRILGDDHPDTLISIGNMGDILHAQGKLTEAEPFFREALERCRRILGDEHPNTLLSISNMGSLLRDQGKFAEAEPYCRDALERFRRILGDNHPDTLTSIGNMGGLLRAQGKLTEAEPYYREALEKRRRILGDNHPSTLGSIHRMGLLLMQTGRYDDAVALLSAAEAATRRAFSDHNADWVAVFLRTLGKALAASAQPQDLASAEAKLVEAHTIFGNLHGPAHKDTRDCVQSLVALYEDWHAAEPASSHDKQAAEWKAKLAEPGKQVPK